MPNPSSADFPNGTSSRPRVGDLEAPLQARFARVKLFLCDVDGVLTDASVYIGGSEEFKRFNIQDGLGLRLLQREGIRVGWISNRHSAATSLRARELQVDFLSQEKGSKVDAAAKILAETQLSFEDICYMGDDVVDLALLQRAGLAVGLPNGIEDTWRHAHYVTRAAGGHGAVREVVELILKAQNKWEGLVKAFLSS